MICVDKYSNKLIPRGKSVSLPIISQVIYTEYYNSSSVAIRPRREAQTLCQASAVPKFLDYLAGPNPACRDRTGESGVS